jgi:hypothetical protein
MSLDEKLNVFGFAKVNQRNIVKAFNFGPLSEKLAIIERRPTKKWRIEVVENLQIYKFGSVNYWYMIHLKKLWNWQKRR